MSSNSMKYFPHNVQKRTANRNNKISKAIWMRKSTFYLYVFNYCNCSYMYFPVLTDQGNKDLTNKELR